MTLKFKPPYLDGYLASYIKRIKALRKKDWDIVIVIDGKERAGKSKFAQILGCSIDETLCLDRITFVPEEFHEAVVKAEKGNVVIMDEAMTAFFSRAAMTKVNVSLVRMLAECGQKNLVIIIVLPSIFVLDSYLALHRASCLFHVYTDKAGERGFFKFYDRKRKKNLYIFGKSSQEYKFAMPNFKGRFTNYTFPWEQEYREKKHTSLMNAFEKKDPKAPTDNLKRDIYLKILEQVGNKKDAQAKMRELGIRFGSDEASKWGEGL